MLAVLLAGCTSVVRDSNLPPVERFQAQKPAQPSRPAKGVGPLAGRAGIRWIYSKPANLRFTRTEVTVGQYRICVRAGTCEERSFKTSSSDNQCNWGHADRRRHPMNCVDWAGAKAFCGWAGGRLPTEAEWYAEASNGGKLVHPWGPQAASCERVIMNDGIPTSRGESGTDGCGKDRSWPICSRPRGNSVSGLCDMIGSVWEWTSDAKGYKRAVRGGGWGEDVGETTFNNKARFLDPADSKYVLNGFRCVRTL
jgi:formylglycine-generating enzyme required for sulfatase activity